MIDILPEASREPDLDEQRRSATVDRQAKDHGAEFSGQMLKVDEALERLRAEGAPLASLKPGQVFRRLSDRLREDGIHARELPSRSTFDRFRRGFGRRYGLR